MNRFGAFGIHLGISFLIFIVLAYLLLFHWYPDFFFDSDGGWQGIRLIALVDLVLGPVLTLIVFNRAKPELKRDLTLIGIFQAICLTAGVYVVYSERPIALAYVDGQFFSMSKGDYLENDRSVPDLSRFAGPYPKRVIVQIPSDIAQQSELRQQALRDRMPLRIHSDRYIDLQYDDLDVDGEALSPEDVSRRAGVDNLQKWLERQGGAIEDYAFFPYAGRYEYSLLAVSTKERRIIGVLKLPLRPAKKPAAEEKHEKEETENLQESERDPAVS